MPPQPDIENPRLKTVSLSLPGGKRVAGALAEPALDLAPAVLMFHEWWGLNDQIQRLAAALSNQGYRVLAADLFHGQITQNAEEASRLMQSLDPKEATDICMGWIDWLYKTQTINGKIGTIGWCLGGGWALNAAIAHPVEATIVYYGRVDHSVDDLAKLKGPVLGHFATRDDWITRPMVERFQRNMAEAGKRAAVHWYDAGHAFANPMRETYDPDQAELAWKRSLEFFREYLFEEPAFANPV